MELETQCPKCKNNVFKQSTALDLDSEITCSVCGHTAKLGDFVTPDARDRILEASKQEWVKALADIPGFKKS